MSISNPQTEERLRQAFKRFNRFMLLLWRLGLGGYGNGTEYGGSIMVITHTGRRSGLRRRTPLNYAIVDGEIYCTAGFGSKADWFRNIQADPEVEVWLPDGWWAGVAEDVSDSPQRVELLRKVLIGSGFAAYAAGINPYQVSDARLAGLIQTYRLVRIRRTHALTGPGGPGELAWIWPLSTCILLSLLLIPRRRHV
jgi:deazaflavin-dependent oxidoreductase (nitroreductase family)